MNSYTLLYSAVNQQAYYYARRALGRSAWDPELDRDRGAVSLEQVLWFVVVGASAAAVGFILFDRIRNTAETTPIVVEEG